MYMKVLINQEGIYSKIYWSIKNDIYTGLRKINILKKALSSQEGNIFKKVLINQEKNKL